MDDECGYKWTDNAHPGHTRKPGQHMCIQHSGHTNGHACTCGAITWDHTIALSDAFPGRQFTAIPTGKA